jgi:hypothetical protein
MFSTSFSIRPPRHPLLRAALAAAGLALLGFFAAFGLAVAVLVLAGFGVRKLLRAVRARVAAPPSRPLDPKVIDGEFSVVRKPHATLLPR